MLCTILHLENSDEFRCTDLKKRTENDYVLNKVEHAMTITVVQSLMIIIIIIILDQYMCTKGVRIVSQWCPTPNTEAKETLDSVPIWFSFLICIRCCFPSSGVFHFNPPSPIFLQTILIRLHCRRHNIPFSFQVNYRILLPPPPHPHP